MVTTLESELLRRGFSIVDEGLNDFQIEMRVGEVGTIFLGGRYWGKWIGIDQGTERSVSWTTTNMSDSELLVCVDSIIECLNKIKDQTQ